MFNNVFNEKRVFITGHTGFKGSWLTHWLVNLGAEVCGFSLDIPTHPSNFEILGLERKIRHVQGDIRDRECLLQAISGFKPDIVFHLAAQSLVRRSFQHPVRTFETNAFGTLNILECIRQTPSVQVAALITSDKAYRNVEWTWGYRENDTLGGEDPYSASKGCAELIIYSYAHSFFQTGPAIASTRAGNVIGGGDWAEDRIVPDAVRAWSQEVPLIVRNPDATRPWQHVLEPLSGYLWLAARLWNKDSNVNRQAFNFGPDAKVNQSVRGLLTTMAKHWQGAQWHIDQGKSDGEKESTLLKLSCDKAMNMLHWRAILSFEKTVAMTAEWYRSFYQQGREGIAKLSRQQIEAYQSDARAEGLEWAQ